MFLLLALTACSEQTLLYSDNGDYALQIASPADQLIVAQGTPVELLALVLDADGLELEPRMVAWNVAGSTWGEAGNDFAVSDLPLGTLELVAEWDADGAVLRDSVIVTVEAGSGGGGDGGGEDTGTEGDGGGGGDDPYCYEEPYFPDADISDLAAGFNSGNARQTMEQVLERRWPAGYDLVDEMSHDPYIDIFLETSSFKMMMDSIGLIAHEETHGWDYEHAGVNTFAYFMRKDLKFETKWYDGFPRSEIYNKVQGSGSNQYKDLYLTGQQGTYGFTELLDEANCYVNDLGGGTITHDYMQWSGVSIRDGAVAFLYYIALYLERARTQYPSFYAEIQADREVQEIVLTMWLRTHFFLITADQHPALGIYDAEIRGYMYDQQDEIERFLDQELDASNCLPD